MNSLKQHRPGFVDMSDKPPTYDFDSTDDLMNLELVKRQARYPGFSHIAIHDECLLAVYDSGAKWFVIGYIKEPKMVDLPQWDAQAAQTIYDALRKKGHDDRKGGAND